MKCRTFLHLAAGAATACLSFCATINLAVADGWPDRPVHVIVPFPPAGAADLVARVIAERFSNAFRQSFIVENRPGASGMIGAHAVARSDPDGYTLLVASPAEIALNQLLTKQMTYDPINDLAPITLLATTPLVFAANPGFDASNMDALVKLAQARQVDFSTPGIGSPMHLTAEYFIRVTNAKLLHIPYKGIAPALTDAVAGQVKLTIAGLTPVVPFLKSGQLKALAVTSKKRSSLFPMIPAMSETQELADSDFINWFGLLSRAGTPPDVLGRLQQESAKALQDPHVREVLSSQAAEPVGNTSDDFRNFIHAETDKYAKIVAFAGLERN